MSWSLRKKKEAIFCTVYFYLPKEIILRFVFSVDV